MKSIKNLFKSPLDKTKAAVKWLGNSIKTLAKKIPDGMVELRTIKHPPVGEIVLFKYDPKHKKTLPYYDEHPLLLVTDYTNEDFWGINLHYIPPDMRKKLITQLYDLKMANMDDYKGYIKKATPLINAIGSSDLFSHCFKQYKAKGHVKSKFAVIKPSYWKVVSALPLQQFKKQDQSVVWKDAKRLRSRKSRQFGF